MAINENQAKSFIKLFDILAPSQTYEHPNLDECLPVVLWPNQKVTLEYTGGRGVKKSPFFASSKRRWRDGSKSHFCVPVSKQLGVFLEALQHENFLFIMGFTIANHALGKPVQLLKYR